MKFAIFGSCVSRDVFDITGHNDLLKHYYARCSVVSAVSDPVAVSGSDIGLNSDFQRRMLISDFQKSFAKGSWKTDTDCLIIDFIDERFGLLRSRVGGGTLRALWNS
jgi:hypothetical protein